MGNEAILLTHHIQLPITIQTKHQLYVLPEKTKGQEIIKKFMMNLRLNYEINSNITYRYVPASTIFALMLKKNNSKKIQTFGHYSNNNDYLACVIRQPFAKKRFVAMLFYTLPVEMDFDYELEEKYIHGNFSRYSYTDIGVTKNLLMLSVSYRFNKGRDIKTIKKKELIEKEKSESFF